MDVSDKEDVIVKMSDFGFAIQADQVCVHHDTSYDAKYGSLYGMAPETLKSNQYSTKVDIWALGVVLYELLTNEHPFLNSCDQNTD